MCGCVSLCECNSCGGLCMCTHDRMSGEDSSCGVCVHLYTRVRMPGECSSCGVCVHLYTHVRMPGECSLYVRVCPCARGCQVSIVHVGDACMSTHMSRCQVSVVHMGYMGYMCM